jgi:hypothetical protein
MTTETGGDIDITFAKPSMGMKKSAKATRLSTNTLTYALKECLLMSGDLQ